MIAIDVLNAVFMKLILQLMLFLTKLHLFFKYFSTFNYSIDVYYLGCVVVVLLIVLAIKWNI